MRPETATWQVEASNGSDDDLVIRKYDASGDLDTTWGDADSGMITFDGGNADEARQIDLDAAGNLYVTGFSENGSDRDLIVRRYDANGDLDTTWGDADSGVVTYDSGDDDLANYVTVDASGSIYVAGKSYDGSTDDLIVRKYDANGDLDTTWGDADSGMVTHATGQNEAAYAVTFDGSGNIFVAGYSNNGSDRDIIVRKYDANGDLDTTWGDSDSGMVTFDGGDTDRGNAVALDAAGNVYVAGFSFNGSDNDLVVRKYDANGDLATGWGDGDSGMVTVDGGGTDAGNHLAIDAAGNLFVAGHSSNGSDEDFFVQKYDANGDVDASWGNSGRQTFDGGGQDRALGIRLDGAGRAYVAGFSHNGTDDDLIVRKYDANGKLAGTTAIDRAAPVILSATSAAGSNEVEVTFSEGRGHFERRSGRPRRRRLRLHRRITRWRDRDQRDGPRRGRLGPRGHPDRGRPHSPRATSTSTPSARPSGRSSTSPTTRRSAGQPSRSTRSTPRRASAFRPSRRTR